MRLPRDRVLRADARLPDGSWLLRALRHHLGVQHPQHEAAVLRGLPPQLHHLRAEQQARRQSQRLSAVRRGQVGAKLQVFLRSDKVL